MIDNDLHHSFIMRVQQMKIQNNALLTMQWRKLNAIVNLDMLIKSLLQLKLGYTYHKFKAHINHILVVYMYT